MCVNRVETLETETEGVGFDFCVLDASLFKTLLKLNFKRICESTDMTHALSHVTHKFSIFTIDSCLQIFL